MLASKTPAAALRLPVFFYACVGVFNKLSCAERGDWPATPAVDRLRPIEAKST
jgi:hypothetical protein